MKIGIIGTRGIPNSYGGFEEFAENLSIGLINRGHEVHVYSPHNHDYKKETWNGVNIIHKYDPEQLIGTAGQFIYDLNCIRDSRSRNFDLILQLGYTSNSIWYFLLPRNSKIYTNMDGLEWKRSKYSTPVRLFLKLAERLAVKSSDHLIADSMGIKEYLKKKYGAESFYIPYGASVDTEFQESDLSKFGLTKFRYFLVICRLEPENNVEAIIDGFLQSESKDDLVIIGGTNTPLGRKLEKKISSENVKFLGAIYNKAILNSLRHYCKLYFHGHSVGGTNPSLLEAMACESLICANDNPFNKFIIGPDGLFFSKAEDISAIIHNLEYPDQYKMSAEFKQNNLEKVRITYNWEKIIEEYEQYFLKTKD